MKRIIAVIIVVVLIALVGIGAYLLLTSPEYAMYKIASDIKTDGIDALQLHLTDDAYKSVKPILSIIESDIAQSLISNAPEEKIAALSEKLGQIVWSLVDIMKSQSRASFKLGFDYNGKLTGTFELILERIEGDWRVAKLDNFEFSNIDLGFGNIKDFKLSDLFG